MFFWVGGCSFGLVGGFVIVFFFVCSWCLYTSSILLGCQCFFVINTLLFTDKKDISKKKCL